MFRPLSAGHTLGTIAGQNESWRAIFVVPSTPLLRLSTYYIRLLFIIPESLVVGE